MRVAQREGVGDREVGGYGPSLKQASKRESGGKRGWHALTWSRLRGSNHETTS